MRRSLSSYILKTILQGPSKEAPKSETFWTEALEFTQNHQITLPFLEGIQEASWKTELSEYTQLVIQERLDRERLICAIHEHEVERVLSALEENSVPTLLLGDLDLLWRFYPNRPDRPPTRSVRENRILVPGSQTIPALRVLGRFGYRTLGEFHSKKPILLKRTPESFSITLQTQLDPFQTESEMDSLWERAEQNASRYRHLLCKEDVFLVLLDQGRKSGFHSLSFFLDLYYLLQTPLQWETLAGKIHAKNETLATWLCLSTLKKYFHFEAPETLTRALGVRKGIKHRILGKTLSPVSKWASPKGLELRYPFLWNLALGERFYAKAKRTRTQHQSEEDLLSSLLEHHLKNIGPVA